MDNVNQMNNNLPEDLKAAINYLNNKGISLDDSFDDVNQFLDEDSKNLQSLDISTQDIDDDDVVFVDDSESDVEDRDYGTSDLDVSDAELNDLDNLF